MEDGIRKTRPGEDVEAAATTERIASPPGDAGSNEDDVYSFRLFAAPPASKSKTETAPQSTTAGDGAANPPQIPHHSHGITKINLSTLSPPPPAAADPQAFHKRSRPLSYYLSQAPTSAQREAYAASAMSGAQICSLAELPCYGLRMKWRVVSATMKAGDPKSTPGSEGKPEMDNESSRRPTASGVDGGATKRERKTRKGKKTRLKIRIKAEEARKVQAETLTKEAYLKEKKRKMNRDKQLKKREKARREKESLGKDSSRAGQIIHSESGQHDESNQGATSD